MKAASAHARSAILGQAFARGAAGTLALRSGFVALEFASGLVLARILGASGYGVYAVVMAWVALLAIPATAGFERLLVREVAALNARGDWGPLRGVLRRSSQIVPGVALLVAIGGALLLRPAVPPDGAQALLWGMLLVPLIAYARVRQAALQGFGRVVLGQLPELLLQPLAFLSLTAVLIVSGVAYASVTAIVLQLIAATLACIVGVVFLRSTVPSVVRSATPLYRTTRWVGTALPFLAMMAMNVVLANADTLLLGMLTDAQTAGIYRIASQMATFVVFPLTALNMAAAPQIAELYAQGDLEGLRQRAASVLRYALLAAVPIALALVILGKPVLRLFGAEFVGGYPALVILCCAYVVNAAVGCAGYLLIMTRFEQHAALTFAAAATASVAASLVLIPIWGLIGAAIATAASLLVLSGGFVLLARRHLGIFALRSDARSRGADEPMMERKR